MADVITRFKLETTQYDSKLRDAAKGLKEVAHQAELGGKGFTGFNQKAIEAARSLGTIESGANNTKDRLKDLVGSFNDAAKAYNNLSKEQQQSDFGKAMAQSLEQLQVRIKDTKQELYGLGNTVEEVKQKSGGLFGEGGFTGMLQVAGGNLLASGIQKLGSEMVDTIQQSIELARQGEGIRMAFERLNRPGLLDHLKEATHGTVSEIELMQQAIKFENFKLPLEDLATYLAFAQQKAKDTGESIDYLVTSIVNGLGRQSKQILDNLGISAAELTKRMSDGADMTKAVADIIREEMEKAGDYVETAADRAARAAADTKNRMEELGREAQPFAEAWAEVWNEISIGGMDFLTYVLGPIADSAKSIRNILNGDFKLKPGIENLADGPSRQKQTKKPTWGDVPEYTAPGGYVEVTDANTGAVIGGQHFDNLNDKNAINAWRKSLHKKTTTKTTGKTTAEKIAFDPNKAILSAEKGVDTMPSVWSMIMANGKTAGVGDQGLRDMLGIGKQQTDLGRILKEYVTDPDKKKREKEKDGDKTSQEQLQGIQTMVGSLQSIVNGIQTLGIELPKELTDIFGVLQTITGIVGSIQAMQEIGTFLGIFKNGGIVPHAAGGTVAGTHYSGDVTPILANAGEVVLNRAQVGNISSQLQGNNQQPSGSPYVTGEMIYLGLTNYLKSTGRGEIMTSRFKQ